MARFFINAISLYIFFYIVNPDRIYEESVRDVFIMLPTTHSFRDALVNLTGQSSSGANCNTWYGCFKYYDTLGSPT